MDEPGLKQMAVVTGAAGFIGSTLSRRLLAEGWAVLGIDSFNPYYDIALKQSNVNSLCSSADFTFVEADLLTADLEPLLADADVVFHLAGQPGVRLSWAGGFSSYVDLNIVVTQRLLEAARAKDALRFVFASSSSVYGNVEQVPTREDRPPKPFSPYGVTKLAAEHLCAAYAQNFGLQVVVLRYFTVYGPRQRPDMAIHRLIEATLDRRPFTLFGDGSHVRDFTFVEDVVDATVRAGTTPRAVGEVLNVAGGGSISMGELIDVVGEAVGVPVLLDRQTAQPGDVYATGGDIRRGEELLGWSPRVRVPDGVAAQVAWHRERRLH